jgi:hypothetical protein
MFWARTRELRAKRSIRFITMTIIVGGPRFPGKGIFFLSPSDLTRIQVLENQSIINKS